MEITIAVTVSEVDNFGYIVRWKCIVSLLCRGKDYGKIVHGKKTVEYREKYGDSV
jgi:hypothetical protein